MASKGKTYDYVFWNDAGSFREISTYKNWPDPTRIEEIFEEGSRLSGTKAEDLLFFPMQHPPYKAKDWNEDMGPIDTDFSEGRQADLVSFFSLILFQLRFILWWLSEYNRLVGTCILRLPWLLRQQTPLRRERSNRLQLRPRSIQRTYHHRMGIWSSSARCRRRTRFPIFEIFPTPRERPRIMWTRMALLPILAFRSADARWDEENLDRSRKATSRCRWKMVEDEIAM